MRPSRDIERDIFAGVPEEAFWTLVAVLSAIAILVAVPLAAIEEPRLGVSLGVPGVAAALVARWRIAGCHQRTDALFAEWMRSRRRERGMG